MELKSQSMVLGIFKYFIIVITIKHKLLLIVYFKKKKKKKNRYGYYGIANKDYISLTPEVVKDIHNLGGSYLGSSRYFYLLIYIKIILMIIKIMLINI